MKKRIHSIVAAAAVSAAAALGPCLGAAAADLGPVKVNGYIQGWYVNNQAAVDKTGFSVRRAEVKLSGQPYPMAGWFLVIDPAKPANIKTAAQGGSLTAAQADPKSMILKDAGLVFSGWQRLPEASLTVGQFKPPFGMEGSASSSEILTVERSALSEVLGWSDYRDLGAMVKYQAGPWKTELAVFNGEGPNTPDANRYKDQAGRISFEPVKSLHLGLAGYHGYGKAARYLNERWGAELSWLSDPWLFKAEFAAGHGATDASSSPAMRTAYGLAGWTFRPKLQAVARFDWWDPNTAAGKDIQNETTIGLNYFIDGHNFKLQANYVVHCSEKPVKPYKIVRTGVQMKF